MSSPDSMRSRLLTGLGLMLGPLGAWSLQPSPRASWLNPAGFPDPSPTDLYLTLIFLFGLVRFMEGVITATSPLRRSWRRRWGRWRLRRHPFPDSLGHRGAGGDPGWAPPQTCRCGEVRPAHRGPCPTCGRPP